MEKPFHLALAMLGLAIANSAGEEKRWFVDRNLVYERGSALSEEYLREHAPNFSKKLEEILPWVVRIEVQHSFAENRYSSNHGTGIVLKSGLVLTAAHVLTENTNGEKRRVILTLADGRVVSAELEQQGKTDWALLRMKLDEKQKSLLGSPVVIGEVIPEETTVFVGYPARLGLDQQGKVQSFRKGDKEKKIPVSKLAPMLVVTSVVDPEVMTLKPLAGFPPVGGMSGGPVLNAKGEVIAVQISVSKTTDNATGQVLYYVVHAVPAGEVAR